MIIELSGRHDVVCGTPGTLGLAVVRAFRGGFRPVVATASREEAAALGIKAMPNTHPKPSTDTPNKYNTRLKNRVLATGLRKRW